MAFIDRLLKEPSYGWATPQGEVARPSFQQLVREAASNINVFSSRKKWLAFYSWFTILALLPFPMTFVGFFFSPWLIPVIVLYGMIVTSVHGTIWYHRYSTHKAYTFSHPFWRILTQHLVIKTITEEVYVLSHHVHHAKSDLPGDPYNATAGFWYCMMADVNHQNVAKGLNERDYNKARRYLAHTGVPIHDYEGYRKWGTVTRPGKTLLIHALNWVFWYGTFFLIGGHALACALFTAALFWFVFVRAFNFTGHGKGENKHQDGVDFDRSNLSINQWRPGTFSGEWHNNHHLYPRSARAGFLPNQLDLAWLYIKMLYRLGAVSKYRDDKANFMESFQEAHKQPGKEAVPVA